MKITVTLEALEWGGVLNALEKLARLETLASRRGRLLETRSRIGEQVEPVLIGKLSSTK